MTTWEYRIEHIGHSTVAARFNELGRDGWELVALLGGSAYFKRPLPVPAEGVSLPPAEGVAVQ